MTELRQRMIEELQLRNSAKETARAYVSSVKRFAAHYRKSPDQLNAEDVRRYLLHLRNERKLSWSGIQVYRAALRFLYVRVLKQRWFDGTILATLYATGLRSQELRHLKTVATWLRRGFLSFNL